MQLAKVPKLAVYSTQKQLKQGRATHKAAFERIFRKKGLIYRYYLDRPCYCVGEYILQSATFTQHGSYLFLQRIHANAWYALHVEQGAVKKEYLQPLDASITALSYDASKVDAVLVATDNEDELSSIALSWSVPTVMALPITFSEDTIGKYSLTNLQGRNRIVFAGVSVVAFAAAALLLWPQKENKETISPWEQWQATPHVDTSLNLHRLVAVLSELYLLPADYERGAIELSAGSDTIKFPILKKVADKASKENFRAWLASVPELSEYVDQQSNIVNLPALTAKKQGVTRYTSLPVELHDALLDFGAKTVAIEPSTLAAGPVQHTRVVATWTTIQFALLTFVAEYAQSQPIYLESLSIDKSETPGVLGSTTLVFIVEVLP